MAKKMKKKEVEQEESKSMSANIKETKVSGETLSGIEENEEEGEGLDKYEISNAADALLRAEEVKQNKKLYAAAKDELAKKGDAIGKITSLEQLRAVASKKIAES